jgi:hypothetical protein
MASAKEADLEELEERALLLNLEAIEQGALGNDAGSVRSLLGALEIDCLLIRARPGLDRLEFLLLRNWLDLSRAQSELGLDSDALGSALECVAHCRGLVAGGPPARELTLAACLSRLALLQNKLGSEEGAFESEREAAEILWRSFLCMPRELAAGLEQVLLRFHSQHERVGRAPSPDLIHRLSVVRAARTLG